MDTNFSLHAFERVLGRISMTHRELASLLDDDLAINIGEEKKGYIRNSQLVNNL